MNLHVITLVIIIIMGIGIPNIFASEIASLKPTGNGSITLSPTPLPTPTSIPTPTPTITSTAPISVPLNLSGANTNDRIIVNETIPTIQQLASNNPNMSSIVVNFSSASNMEAEYDEEEQRLSIEITEAEPNEEITEGETESEESEVGEEEEEDDVDDNDNENNNDNGNDDDNNSDDNGSDLRLPELPDIDLNLPGL
jgi:hypothetical protein